MRACVRACVAWRSGESAGFPFRWHERRSGSLRAVLLDLFFLFLFLFFSPVWSWFLVLARPGGLGSRQVAVVVAVVTGAGNEKN